MLENPKTIINIEDFVKWVASKPKDKKYDYQSKHNCPLAQYFDECCHAENILVRHDSFEYGHFGANKRGDIPLHLAQCIASQNNIMDATHETGAAWTFGALYDRLCEAYH